MYVYKNYNFNFFIGDNIADCTAWDNPDTITI